MAKERDPKKTTLILTYVQIRCNIMRRPEQIYGRQFQQMGKKVFIEITGQLL